MNKDIKFSVTVPAYKSKFLSNCIDSILAQTYKNFELIIVNDASPQDLDNIVNSYHDPRIRYYKNKVGFGAEHVVGNWNKCLEYAIGDYVICMGDDDRLLPNCLEEYIKLIKKHPGLGLYHARLMDIDENNNIIDVSLPLPEYEDVFSLIYARLCRREQYIGDFLFETKSLKEHGGFYDLPYGCCSDDISSFIAAKYKGVAHTRIPVFQYRVSSQTISSSSHNREKMKAINKAFSWIKNFLEKNTTNDYTSTLIRKVCIQSVSKHYLRFVRDVMLADMLSDGLLSGLLYWRRHKKEYHITNNIICEAALKFLVYKSKHF